MKHPGPLPDRVAEYARKHSLFAEGDHVLAAVSGGPDSVALLDILIRLKAYFGLQLVTVAHFDHRLRAEESDEDREFVRQLALQAGLPFHCGTADVRAFSRSEKVSVEMAARTCRHVFFRETAARFGARKIALGHTANDQAEEVLLRIIRGTGPAGAKSMLPGTSGGIIRPLLFAAREDILRHLDENHLDYRSDSSNAQPFCQRNLLRLEVLPILRRAFHPEVVRTISRYAELARGEDSWWDLQVLEAWKSTCVEQTPAGVTLDLEKLRALHPALLRRLLRHAVEQVLGSLSGIQLVHLEPLLAMIPREKPGKSIRFPGRIEAKQAQGKLVIKRLADAGELSGPEPVEINGPGAVSFGLFVLRLDISEASFPPCQALADCVHMDADSISWPLRLRSWQPGDRFRPAGMKGSKKLQDFFTDSRVPKDERHAVPILCDREKICWVGGLRLDDRVKTGPETQRILIAKLDRKPVPYLGESTDAGKTR